MKQSKQNCLEQCLHELIKKHCNCIRPQSMLHQNEEMLPICTKSCRKIPDGDVNDLCNCKTPCKEVSYSSIETFDSFAYHPDSLKTYLEVNQYYEATANESMQTFVNLWKDSLKGVIKDCHFSLHSLMEVHEVFQKTKMVDVFSNIGGIWGFWMEFSILILLKISLNMIEATYKKYKYTHENQLQHLTDSKKWLKSLRNNIAWILMTAFVLGTTIWQTTIVLQEYYDYKVTTITSTKIMNREAFPSITICSKNPVYFHMEELANDIHLHEIYEKLAKLHNNTKPVRQSSSTDYYANLGPEIKLKLLPRLSDVIIQCQYLTATGMKLDCSNDIVEAPLLKADMPHVDAAMCGDLDISTLGDDHHKPIKVYLKLNFPYSRLFPHENGRNNLFLQQSGVYPFWDNLHNILDISPGDFIKIKFFVDEVTKLPSPYESKCIDKYSKYPCNYPTNKDYNSTRYNVYSYQTCKHFASFAYYYYKYMSTEPFDFSKCICGISCKNFEYTIDVQILKYALKERTLYKAFKNLGDLNEEMWTGTSLVEIGPASSLMKDITEKPKIESNSLIGLIGGALGLWVGASITTIILAIYTYGKNVSNYFFAKKKKQPKMSN